MKIPLCIVVLTVLMAVPAMAEDDFGPPRIEVTGTATTKVSPDMIVWHVTLTDEGKDLSELKKQNNQRLQTLLDYKRKLDIDDEDFETGYVNVRRDYDHTRDQGRVFRGFVMTREVTIRQRDMEKFNEFLNALFATQAFEASFVFESTKREEILASTRLDALREAKKKAEDMAAVLDAEIGRPLLIQEQGGHGPMPMQANRVMAMNAEMAGGPAFLPGDIEIKVSVNVVWELD